MTAKCPLQSVAKAEWHNDDYVGLLATIATTRGMALD